jgi:hypothetical protein
MLIDPVSDYGRCPCGGWYADGNVTVRIRLEGDVVELAGVPRATCGNCGSYVYKMADLVRLEGVMKDRWPAALPACDVPLDSLHMGFA